MNIRCNYLNFEGFVSYGFCKRCVSGKSEVRNYDMSWHDGQVHCKICGDYIREYDAG